MPPAGTLSGPARSRRDTRAHRAHAGRRVGGGARRLRHPDRPGLRRVHDRLGRPAARPGRRGARGHPDATRPGGEIDARHGEIYAALNTAPAVLPGVHELVDALGSLQAIPWAIATSSSHADQVRASVAALRLAEPPVVVDGSHVEHAKPAPDLFLHAAERLAVTIASGAGASVTPPGTCWLRSRPGWSAVGVTAGSAVDETALREAGAARVVCVAGRARSALLGGRDL